MNRDQFTRVGRKAAKWLLVPVAGALVLLVVQRFEPQLRAQQRQLQLPWAAPGLPSARVVAGIGMPADGFRHRNAWLSGTGVRSRGLHISLNQPVDAIYDDGDIRFHFGCAANAWFDGDDHYRGLEQVSLLACNGVINDWAAALEQARTLIERFNEENPQALSRGAFIRQYSLKTFLDIYFPAPDSYTVDQYFELYSIVSFEEAARQYRDNSPDSHSSRASKGPLAFHLYSAVGARAICDFVVTRNPARPQAASAAASAGRRPPAMQYDLVLSCRPRLDVAVPLDRS